MPRRHVLRALHQGPGCLHRLRQGRPRAVPPLRRPPLRRQRRGVLRGQHLQLQLCVRLGDVPALRRGGPALLHRFRAPQVRHRKHLLFGVLHQMRDRLLALLRRVRGQALQRLLQVHRQRPRAGRVHLLRVDLLGVLPDGPAVHGFQPVPVGAVRAAVVKGRRSGGLRGDYSLGKGITPCKLAVGSFASRALASGYLSMSKLQSDHSHQSSASPSKCLAPAPSRRFLPVLPTPVRRRIRSRTVPRPGPLGVVAQHLRVAGAKLRPRQLLPVKHLPGPAGHADLPRPRPSHLDQEMPLRVVLPALRGHGGEREREAAPAHVDLPRVQEARQHGLLRELGHAEGGGEGVDEGDRVVQEAEAEEAHGLDGEDAVRGGGRGARGEGGGREVGGGRRGGVGVGGGRGEHGGAGRRGGLRVRGRGEAVRGAGEALDGDGGHEGRRRLEDGARGLVRRGPGGGDGEEGEQARDEHLAGGHLPPQHVPRQRGVDRGEIVDVRLRGVAHAQQLRRQAGRHRRARPRPRRKVAARVAVERDPGQRRRERLERHRRHRC
ncbi:hypothetical protein DFJ74DRAFT_657527 [Hyaloraphidium curvatum]|nr:hypothetical protein DFJ74DRAFT_657527 [Hyaloraphidium curvatum]